MSPALDITSPRAPWQRLALALLASLMLHGLVLNLVHLRMPLTGEVRAMQALLVPLAPGDREGTPVAAPAQRESNAEASAQPESNAEATASRSRQVPARRAVGIAAPAPPVPALSAPLLLSVSVSDDDEPQPLPALDQAGIDLLEYLPVAMLEEHPVPQQPVTPDDPRKLRGEKFRYRVYFLVLLDEAGRVEHVLAVEPDAEKMNLVEAARAALLDARFSAPRAGGRKVKARLFLSVYFTYE
jgi:hypothetical protein